MHMKSSFKHPELERRHCLCLVDTPQHILVSNLQGARLDGADMRGIRGKYAVWRDANWWDAIMDDSLTKALSKKWPKD